MSKVEDSVCADIQTRADFGAKKYGVTMDRTDLNKTQWLQHAYEEALDLAVYLKKILMERETKTPQPHPHAILMAAYALDAAKTTTPWEYWEFCDIEGTYFKEGLWMDCTIPCSWDLKHNYRRKENQ